MKRFRMMRSAAQAIVELLVDRTFEDHAKRCLDTLSNMEDEEWTCHHEDNRTLPVARLVESGMTIGKKRAHLDLPYDHPEDMEVLIARLRSFAQSRHCKGNRKITFVRLADEIEVWSKKSPLQLLADEASSSSS